MRRLGLRLLMVMVGVFVFVFYLSIAILGFLGLRTLWLDRPEPVTTVLVVAALVVLTGYASYRFGTARMLAGLRATEIPRRSAPGLYQRLDRLCERLDVEPPRILVAALPVPNAFALGSVGGTGAVVFDRTLLGPLDPAEIEAILTHELAHVESRDALVQTLAVSMVNTVVGILYLLLLPVLLVLTGLDRSLAWISGRPWYWGRTPFARTGRTLERLVVVIFVGFTAVILAYSRRREFAADDRAASITGNPAALASALETIDKVSRRGGGLLSVLYTHDSEQGRLSRLFSTHPSMESRIRRLQERARAEQSDPGPPHG